MLRVSELKSFRLTFIEPKTFDPVTDPYMFRERLTMPKVIISSAGDEFFLPDDSHYWQAYLLYTDVYSLCSIAYGLCASDVEVDEHRLIIV